MIWLLLAFLFLAAAECLRTLDNGMPWACLALVANIVCFVVFLGTLR